RSGWDRSILSEVNHRLESRMREIRLSGLEGGGTDNRFSLSLYRTRRVFSAAFLSQGCCLEHILASGREAAEPRMAQESRP
ncbi:MAG: hypothetical protein ACLQVL_02605, partial [Terriglobia bacterium]